MQLKSKKRLDVQRKTPNSSSSSSINTPFSPIPQTLIPQTPQTLIPPPPSSSKLHKYGTQVEVSSDEEGFKGAWYLATILKPPSYLSSTSPPNHTQNHTASEDKIFIEYKTLLNEDHKTLLREFVDAKFIRPTPPLDDSNAVFFDVGHQVDAYYQDGWWHGVVTEVITPNSKFKVSFFDPPDEIEFNVDDLRLHRNWVDGHWVLPLYQRMSELSFSPGTAVEVNVEPDNSPDVWYPATLVKQVSTNSFLVEYQSSNETGFQKVTVDSHHIRPPPPIPSSKTLNLLEKVDAFCDCRWLSGVVTKILSDGRYIVYFKCTKKEKELCHAELRLHMDWINGKWVHSSQDTFMASNSEKRSGHANGSYKDKILAASEDSRVMKENVREGRVSAASLKGMGRELQRLGSETVSYDSTTPTSKRTKHTSANGDTVCLRSSRRLNEEAPSGAVMSSKPSKSTVEQSEVSKSGALVEHDTSTANHQGISSLKQSEDSSQPSDSTDIKGDSENRPVSTRRRPGRPRKPVGEYVDLLPTTTQLDAHVKNVDQSPITSQLDAHMDTVDQSPIMSQLDAHADIFDQTPASSDLVKSTFGPIVIGLTHDGKMIGSLAESSGQLLKVDMEPTEDEGKQLAIAADHESMEGKQLAVAADHESMESEPQKGEVTNLKRKRGRPPKVIFRLGGPDSKEAVPESVELEGQEGIDVECSAGRHSTTDDVEKPIAVIEPPPISDSTPSDSHSKRVRIISDQFKRRLGDIHKLSSKRTAKRQVRKNRKIPIAAAMEPANTFILRGKKLKSTKLVNRSADDVEKSRENAVEDPHYVSGKDVQENAVTSSAASDDDKPLSLWFEGAHSPPRSDGRVPMAGSASKCDYSAERRAENVTPAVVRKKEKALEKRVNTLTAKNSWENDVPESEVDTPAQANAIVPRANEDLPFVKHSPIWQMIESMEVLKRFPQQPHFRPLYNCKEECREGLAIGSMVTFTSLVERISQTRFDDPKSLLDGYLEALVDLEELGFIVAPIRDQVNRMLSIKSKDEHAQNTCKEIEGQIMEKIQDKSKIDDEIVELERKIAELKQRKALAVSKRDRKDTEIKLLQSSVNGVKGALESARGEFEKVATSFR